MLHHRKLQEIIEVYGRLQEIIGDLQEIIGGYRRQ